jgi:hypothetical protein
MTLSPVTGERVFVDASNAKRHGLNLDRYRRGRCRPGFVRANAKNTSFVDFLSTGRDWRKTTIRVPRWKNNRGIVAITHMKGCFVLSQEGMAERTTRVSGETGRGSYHKTTSGLGQQTRFVSMPAGVRRSAWT